MAPSSGKKPQNPALGMYLVTAMFGGAFLFFGVQEARYSLFGVTATAKVTHKAGEWRSHKGGSHQVFVLDYSFRDQEGKERVGHDEVHSRWSFGSDETVQIEYIPGAILTSRVKGARNVGILLWIFGVFTAIGGSIAWLLRRSQAKAAVELEPLTSAATDPDSDVPKFSEGSLVCRYAGWMGKPVSVIVDHSAKRIHFQNCFTRRKFLAVSAEPWFSCSFQDLTAAFAHDHRGVHSLVIVTEMGRAWVSDDASDFAALSQTMPSIVPHGGERFNSDHPWMGMLYLGAALAGFFLSWWAMPSSTSNTTLGLVMVGSMFASAIAVHLLVAWVTSASRSRASAVSAFKRLCHIVVTPPGYLGLAGVIIGYVVVRLLGVVDLGTKTLFMVTIGLGGAILGVLLNPAKPNEDERPPKKDTSDRTEDSAEETSASDTANLRDPPNPAKRFVMISGGIGLTSCLLLIWHFAFAKPNPVAVATTTMVTPPPIQPATPVQPTTSMPVATQPPATKVTLPKTPSTQPVLVNPIANVGQQPTERLPSVVEITRPSFLTPERRQQNLLVDGTFEGDAFSKWKLNSFRANKQSGAIEGAVVKEGQKAAVLRTTINDDTHFDQTVTIKPGTRYLLSGWIKTKDVVIDKVDRTYGRAGATLSIWGGYEHSRSLVGTNDWTYSTLIFDARERTEVAVLVRLGYWNSTASGEAWFDDLCLVPIGESPVKPAAQSPPPAPGPAEKDNLLVNGSFEEGPAIPENFGYLPNVHVGSTVIKGWTVTRGNIDVVGRRLWIAGHGQRSVDLHGTPGLGGLKQSFKTVAGQRYVVSFLMAGTPKESISLFKLAVRAADKQQEFSFDATGKTQNQMGWKRQSWDFVAIAAETTLEIHTLQTTAPTYGPVIDDVSVVAADAVKAGLANPVQPASANARQKRAEGDKHRDQAEYAQAIACYREVIQNEPNNAEILNRLAWVLAVSPQKDQPADEALKFALRVNQLQPVNGLYRNSLGAAQYRAGLYAEALSNLAAVVEAPPKNFGWMSHNLLFQTLCHAKRGDREKAQAAYDKALVLLKQAEADMSHRWHEARLLQLEVVALGLLE